MPLAVFIAVILMTSKLASNTEIVAYGNAKISFTRFLKPYMIGAGIITIIALLMNHLVVPNANITRTKFEKTYIKRSKHNEKSIEDFSLQLTDSTYIHLKDFNFQKKSGTNFTKELYKGRKLKYRLTAAYIYWRDSTFNIAGCKERFIRVKEDSLVSSNSIKRDLGFTVEDMIFVESLAQEMTTPKLLDFLKISRDRGVKNLNKYEVELYKRTSLPIATFILTLIAVALTHKKRRGGSGVNLAIGIAIMFIYVFFMKVFEVLGAVPGKNSLMYTWMPNVVFGLFALYLYFKSRK